MKSAERNYETEVAGTTAESQTTLRTDKCIILAIANSTLDRILGKINCNLSHSRNYSSEFNEGKMIGGRMFYQKDLEEYQRNMEGRRIYLSNLSYETQWKYLKDHMRSAGDVVRVDIF